MTTMRALVRIPGGVELVERPRPRPQRGEVLVYAWLERTSMLGKLMTLRAAQRRLHDDLRADIRATFSLADHADALQLARASTSDGKILFAP